ncbi:MAG: CDP-alcohol phosphatidyltransferase family protein, partial [Lachnospiraceae bacterium]|nr:CDP-alcohol phosphatidyltransferase family protein [Lachnospiraceae bacterium]
MMFTAMNYILHLDEFLFPRLGPIETHLFFAGICLIGMADRGNWNFTLYKYVCNPADIVVLAGGVLMYYEMIRLQVQLFKRLRQHEKR